MCECRTELHDIRHAYTETTSHREHADAKTRGKHTHSIHHTGKLPKEAMGHNWVLVNAADFDAVANAGLGAGLANDYVAPGDKRVLAHTKTLGGGQTASITFSTSSLKPGGDYRYLCTFPGHNALMRGTLKFG